MSRAGTAAAIVVAGAAMTGVGVIRGWDATAALPLALSLLVSAVLLAGGARLPTTRSTRTPEPFSSPRVRQLTSRRTLVRGGLIALMACAGAAAAALRWLAPRPHDGTAWRRGTYLVTQDGQRIRAGDVPTGGIATVWPEGAVELDGSSAVVIVRLRSASAQSPTRLQWVVGDTLIAYSKVCTHAGCPVGLFRSEDEALFCPCHQATFDAARGAVPTFGPASRPLQQLPLGTDDGDFLVALGDFAGPVGPVRG